jgi:proline dehydrogenase
MFETLYRRTLLGIAGSTAIEQFLRTRGMRLGVGRFVAGDSLDDALARTRELEAAGMLVILDLLGEFVAEPAGVEVMVREIEAGLAGLAGASGAPAMSVKPTQLGLGIDYEMALANARRIARYAQAAGAEICLDMESHQFVDGTLRLYRAMNDEGFVNVGTVLQSYLRRSEADLESLLGLEPRPTLRIVKGAYREPPEVAFQDKSRVDKQFERMVRRLIEAGGKANIATHDERLLRALGAFLASRSSGADSYEFQFLYGVKPALQRSLLREGHPVRIYVPYGRDWYGYFSRRLAERPANLLFVLRGMFG